MSGTQSLRESQPPARNKASSSLKMRPLQKARIPEAIQWKSGQGEIGQKGNPLGNLPGSTSFQQKNEQSSVPWDSISTDQFSQESEKEIHAGCSGLAMCPPAGPDHKSQNSLPHLFPVRTEDKRLVGDLEGGQEVQPCCGSHACPLICWVTLLSTGHSRAYSGPLLPLETLSASLTLGPRVWLASWRRATNIKGNTKGHGFPRVLLGGSGRSSSWPYFALLCAPVLFLTACRTSGSSARYRERSWPVCLNSGHSCIKSNPLRTPSGPAALVEPWPILIPRI